MIIIFQKNFISSTEISSQKVWIFCMDENMDENRKNQSKVISMLLLCNNYNLFIPDIEKN